MRPTDYSTSVRAQRGDLTDYVVHLTKPRANPSASALQVLVEILNTGFIRPSFAHYKRSSDGVTQPAVKGPFKAVCLTEQPISAILKTLKYSAGRYSGFGIAYYKPTLYEKGGHPVLYGTEDELGQKVREGELGSEVYKGRLPSEMQYLWVRYDPVGNNPWQMKIDFTWEREWRVKFPSPWFQEGLPVGIPNSWSEHQGAIIVAKDANIPEVLSCIECHRRNRVEWTQFIGKVVSLEKAARHIEAKDDRYARLETWPG